MGFDTVSGLQIKCFEGEFKNYNIGDTVPCKEFNFNENLIIMPVCTDLSSDWDCYNFIIIKDSKIVELKSIKDLKEFDFININQVITRRGNITNIKNLNDLFLFIEDLMMLKVKDEINDLKGIYVDNYEIFSLKWIIKK